MATTRRLTITAYEVLDIVEHLADPPSGTVGILVDCPAGPDILWTWADIEENDLHGTLVVNLLGHAGSAVLAFGHDIEEHEPEQHDDYPDWSDLEQTADDFAADLWDDFR
jgi:hypothetical protein